MHELLPEAWGIEAAQSCCLELRCLTRRAPIRDILLWVECFSSLVAILGSAHPHHIVDFMAYQRSIVRASRISQGNAWVIYDRCYRRRVALTKNLNWSMQHIALYSETFTGRAHMIPCCGHCLSENHSLADCPDLPQGMVSLPNTVPSEPPPNSSTSPPHAHQTALQAAATSAEYCCLFNQIWCHSHRCQTSICAPTAPCLTPSWSALPRGGGTGRHHHTIHKSQSVDLPWHNLPS